MNTYDTDTRRLNVGTFWGNLRAVLRRWLDRERELVSLRNAVGMMSEARRSDAAEWHDMREMNREMRADAVRLRRWDEEGKIVGFRGPTANHFDSVVRCCLQSP